MGRDSLSYAASVTDDSGPKAPAGWYHDPAGTLRWWDGQTWGVAAPPPTPPLAPKQVGIDQAGPGTEPASTAGPYSVSVARQKAWLFFLFGAHNWYLNRQPVAGIWLALWVVLVVLILTLFIPSAALQVLAIVAAAPLFIALLVWWIVDLAIMDTLVNDANGRARSNRGLSTPR
ncbi:DUF2510 domain-containing protein [Blautia wexlerae]|uniref:DUF2510 domain-containing protein n=1 Tax=Blautia wexlerae TaxID=418240 RepID=UPI0034A4399B